VYPQHLSLVQRRHHPNQTLSNSQTTTPLLFSLFILADDLENSRFRASLRKSCTHAIVHNEPTQKIPAQTYCGPHATRVSQRFRMFREKLLQKHQRASPPRESPMTHGARRAGPALQHHLYFDFRLCYTGRGQHRRSCS